MANKRATKKVGSRSRTPKETTQKIQEELAELVAAGMSIKDAASELKIAPKTAYGHTEKPEFRARVCQIRTERIESISAEALDAGLTAVRTLQYLATGAEKESDQISACKVILDKVVVLAEQAELRRRLDELERAAEASRQTTGEHSPAAD